MKHGLDPIVQSYKKMTDQPNEFEIHGYIMDIYKIQSRNFKTEGQFGPDPKIKKFEDVLKNLKIFSMDKKLLEYGTEGSRTRVSPNDIDYDFDHRLMIKSFVDLGKKLENYYKEIYKLKPTNVEDDVRKMINQSIRGLVGSILVVVWKEQILGIE